MKYPVFRGNYFPVSGSVTLIKNNIFPKRELEEKKIAGQNPRKKNEQFKSSLESPFQEYGTGFSSDFVVVILNQPLLPREWEPRVQRKRAYQSSNLLL